MEDSVMFYSKVGIEPVKLTIPRFLLSYSIDMCCYNKVLLPSNSTFSSPSSLYNDASTSDSSGPRTISLILLIHF